MDDEVAENANQEGPRRKTYEPPSQDAEFSPDEPAMGGGGDAPAGPPSPTYPEPPIRRSLSEASILEKFQDPSAGSTTELIAELEKQVLLKEEEEEAFESWAEVVRNLRGEKAEPYIRRQRIIFDGGDPGPLEEEQIPQDEPEDKETSTEPDTGPEVEPEAEAKDDVADEPEPQSEGTIVDAVENMPEPASDTETAPQDEQPVGDSRPASQTESVQEKPPTVAHASSLGMTLGTWWGVGIPLAALVTGGYLSFRGLGFVESLVVLGSVALVVGVIVSVLAHQSFRRGLSASDLMARTFGRAGAVVPGVLMIVGQLATITFLTWWASHVTLGILSGAGLWPYEPLIGQVGAAAVAVVVVAALSLTPPRVLQVSLIVGSVAALAGLVLLLVLSIPTLDLSLTWAWNTPWMAVVSAGSVLLALVTLVVLTPAADLPGLSPRGNSRFGGALSAVVVVVPFSALAVVAVLMAQSSPLVSLGLLANPVAILVADAPAFYPGIAVFVAVVPILTVTALLTRSLGLTTSTLRIPGWRIVHTAVALLVVVGLGAVVFSLQLNLKNYVVDVGLTLGVVAVTIAAVLAKEWALLGSRRSHEVPRLRVLPLVAVVFPSLIGWGMLSPTVSWLAWQGYLFPLLELAGLIDLSPASPGLLIAFVLAGLMSGVGSLAEWVRSRKALHA